MDQMGVGLVLLYLVFALIAGSTGIQWLLFIGYIPGVYCFWRMFSRNIMARQRENMIFLRYWRPVQSNIQIMIGKCRTLIDQLRDREHKYFRCASCGATLRVPRGKGKLQVTCPKCRTMIQTRS